MEADFWWLVTVACLVWYSTITAYVSIRGAWDIKNMLARLQALDTDHEEEDA
ncbi:MAG: hypothetical protein HY288_14770 [Planctomycetia bacterium]|nr:hypothetical protein [Planctomycetia bacterium]